MPLIAAPLSNQDKTIEKCWQAAICVHYQCSLNQCIAKFSLKVRAMA